MIRHDISLMDTTELVECFRKCERIPRDIRSARPTVDILFQLHLDLISIMCDKDFNTLPPHPIPYVGNWGQYLNLCDDYYRMKVGFLAGDSVNVEVHSYFDSLVKINDYLDYTPEIQAGYYELYSDATYHISSPAIMNDLYFTNQVLRLFSLWPSMLRDVKYKFSDDFTKTLFMLHYLPLLYNFLFNFSAKLSIIE